MRKLRGEYGGDDSDRQRQSSARPRKQMLGGEEDDQPTYVVEDSQDTLSKAEYEAIRNRSETDTESKRTGAIDLISSAREDTRNEGDFGSVTKEVGKIDEIPLDKQEVAGIGGSAKRKVGKVIDDGEDRAPVVEDEAAAEQPKQLRQVRGKRTKKVKLSFDDDAARDG